MEVFLTRRIGAVSFPARSGGQGVREVFSGSDPSAYIAHQALNLIGDFRSRFIPVGSGYSLHAVLVQFVQVEFDLFGNGILAADDDDVRSSEPLVLL